MRFASLGSGSKGNALLVEAGQTRVLLDCGFGLRETAARLARLGIRPEDLSGILITHEHGDHIAGAFALASRWQLKIWMSYGTLSACRSAGRDEMGMEIIDSHQTFHIGELEIQSFPVPHDAREPVQFTISDGRHRLAVLTDLGCSTPHVERMLSGCDALVLECNHDKELLRTSNYPALLKRRIGGCLGHLDNASAAGLLRAIDVSRLQHIFAAHLSRQNNTPALARMAFSAALGCADEWIGVADQDYGFGWRDLL